MGLFADRSITPLADFDSIVFEVYGKSYRDKKTWAWCTPVLFTIWTDHSKWMFWRWNVTEYIRRMPVEH
jgi:hypothetical protein